MSKERKGSWSKVREEKTLSVPLCRQAYEKLVALADAYETDPATYATVLLEHEIFCAMVKK